MPRQAHNPIKLFDSVQYGFSQITVGEGSRIVTISGQVGWDETGRMAGDGSFRTQTMKAFENLQVAMETVGGTLDDILSLRIYIHHMMIHETAPIREGLQTFFPDSPPTATWLAVPALANPDFLIEIEAMAILAG